MDGSQKTIDEIRGHKNFWMRRTNWIWKHKWAGTSNTLSIVGKWQKIRPAVNPQVSVQNIHWTELITLKLVHDMTALTVQFYTRPPEPQKHYPSKEKKKTSNKNLREWIWWFLSTSTLQHSSCSATGIRSKRQLSTRILIMSPTPPPQRNSIL